MYSSVEGMSVRLGPVRAGVLPIMVLKPGFRPGGQGEVLPDVQPVTVVLVDLLATDLQVHVVDQLVADVGHPGHGAAGGGDLGQGHLQVGLVDQVTVPADCTLDLLAEVGHT